MEFPQRLPRMIPPSDIIFFYSVFFFYMFFHSFIFLFVCMPVVRNHFSNLLFPSESSTPSCRSSSSSSSTVRVDLVYCEPFSSSIHINSEQQCFPVAQLRRKLPLVRTRRLKFCVRVCVCACCVCVCVCVLCVGLCACLLYGFKGLVRSTSQVTLLSSLFFMCAFPVFILGVYFSFFVLHFLFLLFLICRQST